MKGVKKNNHKPIPVIFLHPHFTLPGGAGRMALEIAHRLNPLKYKVYMLCIYAAPEYKQYFPNIRFVELGGPLSSQFSFWLRWIWLQIKIHNYLNQFDHLILFPHVFPANWWAFIYTLWHPHVPCIWLCQEPSAFIHYRAWINSISSPLMKFWVKLCNPLLKAIDMFLVARSADYLFCNSVYSAGEIQKIYKRSDAIVAYPGVDLSLFNEAKCKKNIILTVGLLTRFKQVHLIIEAMRFIHDEDMILIIVGDGEDKGRLIDLAQKGGLNQRVKFFTGITDQQLAQLYGQAKIFVLASLYEPFGMVAAEALACGTPVIGHNGGGLKEIVQDKHNGILLNELTPQTIASAIDTMLKNPEMHERLMQNARFSVMHFNWEQSVSKVEEIIDLISHAKAAPIGFDDNP
ncbi:MAG: glycosyltransferase family 4 protein [Desulfobacterales bacterium]|nr:glycosyltransferase family 4 protein [Desulfobacterales bacterium]